MTQLDRRVFSLIGALMGLVQPSFAQQPPDNVLSDGYLNTASGNNALMNLNVEGGTGGKNDSAFGAGSLQLNTTGAFNTAAGADALYSNSTGSSNAAFGSSALQTNTTGANNTAFGYLALFSNTTGKGNAAQGTNALYNNTIGIRNLGIGSNALYGNTTGSYNIAFGFDAGYNVTTGSNNIEIGTAGSATDDNTIQIGVQGTQTTTTIAGIYGTPVTGSAVYVTPSGQLGVQAPSSGGTALMVQDSNGVTVGHYFSNFAGSDFVVMKTAGGQPFSMPLNATGFGAYLNSVPSGAVVFTTTNCTGTPYLAASFSSLSLIPPGIIAGSTAYVPGPLISPITYQSYFTVGNTYPYGQTTAPTCVLSTDNTAVYSVLGTFDLSLFVLPFAVH